MRITDFRIPMIAAVFVAIILSAIPQYANAQANLPPGFDPQACAQNMQNGYTRAAQDRTAAAYKIYANAPIPSMKLIYCWSTLAGIWAALGNIFTIGNGVNSTLGTILWNLVTAALNFIITSVGNAICGIITAAIQQVKSYITSLLCIALPHFNLKFNLPSFGGGQGACQGVNILNLINGVGAAQQSAPGVQSIWGLNRQY